MRYGRSLKRRLNKEFDPLSRISQPDVYSSSNLRKHTSANPLQRWLLRRFHQTAALLFAQTAACSVLDAGCGEGFAMREVLGLIDAGQQPESVVGLDGSAGALHIARSLHSQRVFAAADLQEIPFADQSFDLVMCMEVLEHLDRPERGLAELVRVSRRWLLLSVPNEPFFRGANFLRGKNMHDWGNDPGHINHWSAQSFLQFVAQSTLIESWRTSFPWTLVLCRTA